MTSKSLAFNTTFQSEGAGPRLATAEYQLTQSANEIGGNNNSAVDYFLLRLSELEYRVRQTESYIKLSDELRDVKAQKALDKKREKQGLVLALADRINECEQGLKGLAGTKTSI